MKYLPINLKRFYVDVLVAGFVVILAFLFYVTGKAEAVASNLMFPDLPQDSIY